MSTQRDNPVKWQASRVAAIQMVSTHDIAANLKDFDTEFVSWDAWVAIEGKFSQVTA